jgi:hypothetical protein
VNLEKVVFGFFVLLAATLNFGFFVGDPRPRRPQFLGTVRCARSRSSEALTILSREMGGETTLIQPAGSLVVFDWFSRQSVFGGIGFDRIG